MKFVLALEDNSRTIAKLLVWLRYKQVQCILTTDLSAWKHELQRFKQNKKMPDLFIIDDNLYNEDSLEKIGLTNFTTNDGQDTGAELTKVLKTEQSGQIFKTNKKPAFLEPYQAVPIIIYSVHEERDVKNKLGKIAERDDVSVIRKNIIQRNFKVIQEKCIEILKLS